MNQVIFWAFPLSKVRAGPTKSPEDLERLYAWPCSALISAVGIDLYGFEGRSVWIWIYGEFWGILLVPFAIWLPSGLCWSWIFLHRWSWKERASGCLPTYSKSSLLPSWMRDLHVLPVCRQLIQVLIHPVPNMPSCKHPSPETSPNLHLSSCHLKSSQVRARDRL